MNRLPFIVALFTVLAIPSFATNETPAAEQKAAEHRSFVSDRVIDQLKLTEDQKSRLSTLKVAFAKEQDAWYASHKNGVKDYSSLHKIRVEYRAKFRDDLTGTQQATFDKAMEDAKKRMAERRQAGKSQDDDDDDKTDKTEKTDKK